MSDSQQLTAFKQVQQQLEIRTPEFQRMLPAHIRPERFMRVSLIAIQTNPKLLLVPQGALFRALMQCAQDGLLPDGREAALVAYTLRGRDGKPPQTVVSYQPMIAGIRKKAWNSGELASWEAYLVHRADHFEIVLGSDPRIEHKPVLQDRGPIIAVYSVAKFKNGATSMDWMALEEVETIRRRSRASDDGPWVTDFGEMMKKTMLRRHSKALPLSSELDNLIRREDELYEPLYPRPIDLRPEEPPAEEAPQPRKRGRPKLSDFRKDSPPQTREASSAPLESGDDSHSGEHSAPQDPAPRNGADDPEGFQESAVSKARSPELNEEFDLASQAESAGYDAYFDGRGQAPIPKQFRGTKATIEAYHAGLRRARDESLAGDDQDTQAAE